MFMLGFVAVFPLSQLYVSGEGCGVWCAKITNLNVNMNTDTLKYTA